MFVDVPTKVFTGLYPPGYRRIVATKDNVSDTIIKERNKIIQDKKVPFGLIAYD
jgi:hypothetical protein